MSVRFGNVLGSRGSVLTSFRQQVADGGPVTVTHPDVTRYFMLTTEAVQLVIQAGALGLPGEVLVLDMGHPVKIAEVAQALIRRSGKDVPIVYTGMRPGEKLHEDLLGTGEVDVRPSHPLITQAGVPPLHPRIVRALDPDSARGQLTNVMSQLCATALGPDDLDGPGLQPVDVRGRG